MLDGARLTPGNSYTCIIVLDNDLIHSNWGGGAKYFLFPQGSLTKILIFYFLTLSIHFKSYAFQNIEAISMKIKYGCVPVGVVTLAIEILQMPEITLDPHLGLKLS